ncbi:MAG: hypothetical protein H7Z42_13720, partial [Roseiflexaceae bacterium]|nr:hypothetical protein [Roseiflexaceae bacterium]
MQKLYVSILIVAGLVLSACGGQPVVSTTPVATSAPLAVQPTPFFESVTSVPEGPSATIAPVAPVAVQSAGALGWRDQVLRSDAVTVLVTGLISPTAGQVYEAWLG